MPFDGEDDVDSFEQPQQQSSASEASQFVTDPDEDISLPSSFSGGLDRLRARSEREAFKYRQDAFKNPVYNINGQLSKSPPDRSQYGQFIPMGGTPSYVGIDEDAFVPVQEKMARQAEARIPRLPDGSPLTDEHVFASRNQIYQQLLQGANGKLNSETFINNPFWDQFKGLDNDSMAAFKKSVLSNIQPIYKFHRQVDDLKQQFKDTLTDEDNPWGKTLLGSLSPEAQQQISAVLSGKSTNIRFAQGVLRTIQEKKEILSDPDNAKLFSDLGNAESGTEDNRMFRHLMDTHSGSAFASGLAQVSKKIQKRQDIRDKTIEDANVWMEKNVQEGSPIRDVISGKMQELSDAGVFDKNPSLATKILRIAQEKNAEFDLGTDRDGNPLGKMYGLKTVIDEGKAREKIKELVDRGIDPSQIRIDDQYKVYEGEHALEFDKRFMKMQFGDTSLNGKGQWIALPKGKLQDSAGNEVVLSDGSEHEVSPIAFEFQDKVLMRRDELEKLGVTKDELKEEAPVIIPEKYNSLLAREAKQYKPPTVTAEDFLKDKDAEGKPIYDGQRFAAYHPDIDAIRQNMEQVDKNLTKHFFNLPPKNDASYPWEVTKGLLKGFSNGLIAAGYFAPAVINTSKNALIGSIYEIMGDDKTANEYYNKGLGAGNTLSSVDLDQQVAEATEGGFLHFDKLNMNQNATDNQKIAFTISEGIGNLVSMGVEMSLSGPAGVESAANKIAGFGSKMMGYEKQLAALQSMTGNADKIMNLTKNQQRFAATLKSVADMSLLGIIQGHTKPAEMAESAVSGALQAIPMVYGKGLSIPFFGKPSETVVKEIEGAYKAASGASPSFYETATRELPSKFELPDWTRVGAAAISMGAMGSIDFYRKKFEGMTTEEILQTYKNPTELANLGLNAAMSILRSHDYKAINLERKFQPLSTEKSGGLVGKDLGIRISPIKTAEMNMSEHVANTQEYLKLVSKGKSRTKEDNARMSELVQQLAPPTNSSTKFDQIAHMDGLAKKINDPATSPEDKALATAEFHALFDQVMSPKSSVEDPIVKAKDQESWDEVQKIVKSGKVEEESVPTGEVTRLEGSKLVVHEGGITQVVGSEHNSQSIIEGEQYLVKSGKLTQEDISQLRHESINKWLELGRPGNAFEDFYAKELRKITPRESIEEKLPSTKEDVTSSDNKEAAKIVKRLQKTYNEIGTSRTSDLFKRLENKAVLNARIQSVADSLEKGDNPNEVLSALRSDGLNQAEAEDAINKHFKIQAHDMFREGKSINEVESSLKKSGLEEAGLDPKEITESAFEDYNRKAGEIQSTDAESLLKQANDQGCEL